MLFHNFLCLVGGHVDVGYLFLTCLVDLYNRLKLAVTNTAGLGNSNLFARLLRYRR